METILSFIAAIAGPAVPGLIGSLFTNRLGVYLALGAAVLGFAGGVYVTKKFWDASELLAVNEAMSLQQVQFKTVIKVEKVIQEKIIEVEKQGKEIIREIPKIITREVEKSCPAGVPYGFARVHDAAAANRPAGPAALTDADPTGITLAETGQTIAGNYEQYHICRQQVIGWNLFYGCLRSASDQAGIGRCIADGGVK
jgi:hypothetical protein